MSLGATHVSGCGRQRSRCPCSPPTPSHSPTPTQKLSLPGRVGVHPFLTSFYTYLRGRSRVETLLLSPSHTPSSLLSTFRPPRPRRRPEDVPVRKCRPGRHGKVGQSSQGGSRVPGRPGDPDHDRLTLVRKAPPTPPCWTTRDRGSDDGPWT